MAVQLSKDMNAAGGNLPVGAKFPNTNGGESKINWMVNGTTQTQQLTQDQRKRYQSR